MIPRVNISIDDVSPHPMSSIDVVDNCMRVIDTYPDVKFTLFVPTAYWRTMHIPGRPDTRTPEPLVLSKHPEFCRRLRELPQDNFEVGYHGRHHGIPGRSNNDEMRFIDERGMINLIASMRQDVEDAGLDDVFKDILRPPAMYLNSNALPAASRHFDCLALSPRKIHKNSYGAAEHDADNIVYANVWLPDDSLDDTTSGDIEVLYHACEWDGGYLDDARVNELLMWLEEVEPQFCFIEELLK